MPKGSEARPVTVATTAKLVPFTTLTEFDPPAFERQALRVIEAWSLQHGSWPDFVRLMGHNHLTSTFHLNTDDDYLGVQMLRFMAKA